MASSWGATHIQGYSQSDLLVVSQPFGVRLLWASLGDVDSQSASTRQFAHVKAQRALRVVNSGFH